MSFVVSLYCQATSLRTKEIDPYMHGSRFKQLSYLNEILSLKVNYKKNMYLPPSYLAKVMYKSAKIFVKTIISILDISS